MQKYVKSLGGSGRRNTAITLFCVVLVAAATHWPWFIPGSIFSYGDWLYWPHEALSQLGIGAGAWVGFIQSGYANIQIYFLPWKSIWAAMANFGLSYGPIVFLTFLLPIALGGFLCPYYFILQITKKPSIGFCVALFYGSVTYFLIRQLSHLPIAFVFAFAPLVLGLLLIAIDKNRPKHWVVLALFLSFVAFYELRITYIVVLAMSLFLAAFCLPKIKLYWRNIALFGLVFVGFNAFWILPTFLGGLLADVGAVANRGLFGNWWFDLQHALTISDPSWTGSYPDRYFIRQPVMLLSWVAPVLALLSPLVVKKPRRLLAAVFLMVSIIGILLTKQSAAPWPGLYLWLYEHVPGFNLFREASKFYLLTALGYSGLLALGMEGAIARLGGTGKRVFTFFTVVLFITLAAYNTKPLISGEIGTMFKPRTISNDYILFEKFINKQDGFFRTLWVPTISRWSAFSIEHPRVSLVNANTASWSRYIDKEIVRDQTKTQNIVAFLKGKDAQDVLADSSIKYVVIPIKDVENDDNFFRHYGNNRQYYINEIRKLKYLKPVDIGAKELLVFENKQYEPHVQGKDLRFKQINPNKFLVRIRGINGSKALRFNEAYHDSWKIYSAKRRDFRGQWISYPRSQTMEVVDDYLFMQGEEISYLWREPVFDQAHRKTKDSLNEWVLDSRAIKKTWPKGSYQVNDNGSIDVDLVIYFKPHSYFYLGLIISVITFMGCIGWLVWEWWKRRKNNEKQSAIPASSGRQSAS